MTWKNAISKAPSDSYTPSFPLAREIENKINTVKRMYSKIHIFENEKDYGKLAFANTEFEEMLSSMRELINDMDSFIEEVKRATRK